MRRAALLLLMIILALLTACSGSKRLAESFELWRVEFNGVETRTITAEVTALSEESETVFVLTCKISGEENQLEVLSPEMLSGVKAHTLEGETELIYDGSVLSLGTDPSGRCSPMTALPLFTTFIRQGHFEGAWTETFQGKQVVVTELEDSQGRKMLLWQEKVSMQPLFASIRSSDNTELKIQIQKIE